MDNANSYSKLQKLLDDPDISEIMINGPRKIFAEKKGTKILTDVAFTNDAEILHMVESIFTAKGKRVDREIPYADVCLDDGTRINAIIPPLSRFGVSVTFRKFSKQIQTADDLLRLGTLTKPSLDFLIQCVKNRYNIIISGGTGVGKTTILQILTHYFDPSERVITIEDAAELKLKQANVVSLETQLPDPNGKGGVTLRDLIHNALRMTPDRLIVGEIRSDEAIDLIQSMATGHAGTMGILHGNSPREVISRLETMIIVSGITLPLGDIRRLIAGTVQIIVHVAKVEDGKRKVTYISAVEGITGGEVSLQELFGYRIEKKDATGNSVWGLMQLVPLSSTMTFRSN
ncbi:MAG: ATPase, T2SS/T4P/T4SS family [Elusimicrobiota bacterium]